MTTEEENYCIDCNLNIADMCGVCERLHIKEARKELIEEIEKIIEKCDTPDNNKLKVHLKRELNKLKEKKQ